MILRSVVLVVTFCGFGSFLSFGPAHAVTIHVPGEQPTIQVGLDVAGAGDTVLVACGDYQEHDIVMKSGVTLISELWVADCVEIDAQGLGRVLSVENCDELTSIEGFTLANGLSSQGGAVYCANGSPTFFNCDFRDNESTMSGGAVYSLGSGGPAFSHCRFLRNEAFFDAGAVYCLGMTTPTFLSCEFLDNTSGHSGGAIRSEGTTQPTLSTCTFAANSSDFGGAFISYNISMPILSSCTFSENSAIEGAAIFCGGDSQLTLMNSILAFSTGPALSCDFNGAPTLLCSDIYGNSGGDWAGCIAGQASLNGNFSADPAFCGVSGSWNFFLQADSPCSPTINPCGLVGANPVFCGETATKPLSWSRLKSLY